MALFVAGAEKHAVNLCFEIVLDGDTPPEWGELLPAGKDVVGRDGRKWINPDPLGVLEAVNSVTRPIIVDENHASELRAHKGLPAPAMARFTDFVIRRGGSLWGKLDWTPEGRAKVTGGEYRFLSPAIQFETKTRKIIGISSAGLTNQPNLELSALNAEINGGNAKMDPKLLEKLGLKADATEAEINAAVAKLVETSTAKNTDESKLVPRADYDLALNRAKVAEGKIKETETKEFETAVNAAIESAVTAGVVAPSSKDYHKSTIKTADGLNAFQEWAKTAPKVVGESNIDKKTPPNTSKSTELNAEEAEVCRRLGMPHKDYLETKNAEL